MTNFEDALEVPPFIAPRMSWPAWLLVVGSASGAIGYAAYLGDYVVSGSIAVVLITALIGFRMGLTRMAASLGAFAAAVMFAPQLGMTYENYFTDWFGTTGLLNRVIAIGAIGIVMSLVATIVLSIITNRVLRTRPRLARTNSWFGFTAGAAQGAVAVLLFLGGLLVVEPMQLQMANEDAKATESTRPEASKKMTQAMLAVSDSTHSSRLGPVIEEYNPFERFEPLKKFDQIQQSVRVLSSPQKINELLRHPAIERLQNRPEIKDAVASLMDDAEISKVLRSGTMTGDSAVQLLSHPAILELMDNADFIEEAGKVINESRQDLTVEI